MPNPNMSPHDLPAGFMASGESSTMSPRDEVALRVAGGASHRDALAPTMHDLGLSGFVSKQEMERMINAGKSLMGMPPWEETDV